MIEREPHPRPVKLAIQQVETNHFIPRAFIRDFWALNGKVMRWRRDKEGWSSASLSFGQGGFKSNLYSPRLEAYFGLLEGDAKLPIQHLLQTVPLNLPQRKSLVGFLIVQILRNPSFIARLRQGMVPVLEKSGHIDDP